MNAAESAFRETERDRKTTARSSKYRICGSKSKKCSLPSDGLTKKEWRERNGELMYYNLNSVIKWADFMNMPRDLQKEYLKKCFEHNARSADMIEMMGTSSVNFSHYIANHMPEVRDYMKVKTKKTPDDEWLEYLKTLRGEDEPKEEEDLEETEEPEEIPKEIHVNKVPIESPAKLGSLTYSGIGMSILMNIAKVIDPNRKYQIDFHFLDVEDKVEEN